MFQIFGNSTANDTIKWQPDPTTRGTFGILSSCLITISLCIWTAVHLNVPEHDGDFRQLLRKGKWLLIGLVAPEMVLFTAWYQYVRARETARLVSEYLTKFKTSGYVVKEAPSAVSVTEEGEANPVNGDIAAPASLGREPSLDNEQDSSDVVRVVEPSSKVEPQPESTESTSQTQVKDAETKEEVGEVEPDLERGSIEKTVEWSIKQGFFVNMGGLAFDTRKARDVFLPKSCPPQLHFTAAGIERLCILHPEIFESIDSDKIDDKSKAGGFGKTLVCLQALWFMAQCLSRLAQGLPISLLELNTSGHCICALIIYVLWWHKPLDVKQPTLISGEIYWPTLAWMWMGPSEVFAFPEALTVTYEQESQYDELLPVSPGTFAKASTQILGRVESQVVLTKGEELLDTGLYFGSRYPHGRNRSHEKRILTTTVIRRWKLASLVYKTFGTPDYPYSIKIHRKSNFELPSDLSTSNHLLAWAVLIFSSVVYGGLHMIAWNAPFRTETEQILWRISAPSLMAYGFLFAGQVEFIIWCENEFFYFPNLSPNEVKAGFAKASKDLARNMGLLGVETESPGLLLAKVLVAVFMFFYYLFPMITLFASLLYILARVFLVVECFLSLFHAPPGLFHQPNWGPYFPHIS